MGVGLLYSMGVGLLYSMGVGTHAAVALVEMKIYPTMEKCHLAYYKGEEHDG